MKLEFMANLGYATMAPEAVCESLAGLGYKGVGWTRSHFDVETKSQRELTDLLTLPARYGMGVGELVIQQDLVTNDDALYARRMEIVLKSIEAASAVDNPPAINLFTGPATWNPAAPVIGRDITYAGAWDRVVRAFEAFVPRAEALGVDLALEGVWGMLCHDFFTTNHLVEMFDSPRLGVNYDPSHDVLVGIEDAGWVIRQWQKKKRIKHVHLKDAAGVADGGRFLFPLLGEGRVDWPGLFAAFADTGYDGFMSLEFESFRYYDTVLDGDPHEAARISIDQIRKLARPSVPRGATAGHAVQT